MSEEQNKKLYSEIEDICKAFEINCSRQQIIEAVIEVFERITADQKAKVIRLCNYLDGAFVLTRDGYGCVDCGETSWNCEDFKHKPGCIRELAKQLKEELQ